MSLYTFIYNKWKETSDKQKNSLFLFLGLNRKNIVDQRVHCCLYFIPPYGHGLRQIDLEFLKRLQYKVNLVPVIGKADTLTKPEVGYRICWRGVPVKILT